MTVPTKKKSITENKKAISSVIHVSGKTKINPNNEGFTRGDFETVLKKISRPLVKSD